MDPSTIMAIMNVVGQMSSNAGQSQQQSAPQSTQPGIKPYTPGSIPALNTTDYGAIIKQMMNQQQNPIPGMPPGGPGTVMPGQGQSF